MLINSSVQEIGWLTCSAATDVGMLEKMCRVPLFVHLILTRVVAAIVPSCFCAL